MSIEILHLTEPKLQFGEYFEHEDTKTGLAEFGPFGKSVEGLHPAEIKLGFIGTRETIEGAKEWIEECKGEIESENIKEIKSAATAQDSSSQISLLSQGGTSEEAEEEGRYRVYKILNRDFIGFSKSSRFESEFQTNQRWDRVLQPRNIDDVLKLPDKEERILRLVDLFEHEIRTLSENSPSPQVIILALTPEMLKNAHAVQLTGNFYLNFRRAIKARAMKWKIPIQLIQQATVQGKGADIQEKATRAWNFCTALYYKADGIPWRSASVERDTCFVGISFFVARDDKGRIAMRSSVAQAFDYLGQGLIVRGDPFAWDEDKNGRSPHLRREDARKLIRTTLERYRDVQGTPPRRVVLHKRSRYWGEEHGEYDELTGLYEGINDVFSRCETDFVTLSQSGIRLFREGRYPPARGTYINVNQTAYLLYTAGFVPYLDTFPGSYVPSPWQIVEHHGGSSMKELFREVLELTKMNVNNCSYADGVPITLSFSEKIGEIMKHAEGQDIQTHYKFYM